MKNYYYIKEILFGLREEYLKNEEELRKLKEFVVLDENIENVGFTSFSRKNKRPELICDLEEKQLKITNALINIGRIFNKKCKKQEEVVCLKTNNDEFVIPKEGVNIFWKDEFGKKANSILSSDFNTEVKDYSIIYSDNEMTSYLDLGNFAISFRVSSAEDWDLVSKVDYFIKDDVLRFQPRGEKGRLDKIFNLKLSKELFNIYQRIIIENSSSSKKDILVEKEDLNNTGYYQINNDEKAIILVRK